MGSSPNINWTDMRDAQREITRWADEQFPGRTDHQTIFKLVVHEVPELMIHKKEKGVEGIGTELADAMILLLDLASMWGVDMADAIRLKMDINYGRVWERDPHGIMQHVPHPARPPEDLPKQAGPCVRCGSTNTRMLTVEQCKVTQFAGLLQDDAACDECHSTFDSNIPF